MHHSKRRASLLTSLFLLALLILPPVASEAVTLDELREQVRILQNQIANIQTTPLPDSTKTHLLCVTLRRNLARTMRGNDVKELQSMLAARGFLIEDSVTGYFGALTEKAVQEFQQRENILMSGSSHENGFGNAGPRTRAALAVCPPLPTTAPDSTPIQTSTTSQGAATLPTATPTPPAQTGTVLASFTENNSSTRNNAIRLGQAYLLPLAYSPLSSAHPLAFAASVQGTTQTITAYNADAVARWSVPALGQGQMTSGFDVNADGFPDVAIERKEASGTPPCNSTAMSRTWLELYSGENGTLLYRTEPTLDKCDGYAIPLWGLSSIAFGNTSAGTISLAKYYETEGTFFSLAGGQTTTHAFIYPSVPEYDSYYQNDTSLNTIHPDQGTSATSFVNGSHVQNGLTLLRNGINRFVLFTSQRAAQYHIGPKSATQLLADRPFIGTHPSLAGRNYGLVSVDPQSTNHVSIVASGATIGMFRDMLAGKVTNEPEAGGERHVSIYNLDANTVDQKYHGSVVIADGSPDPFYNNRIIHPGHVYLPSTNTYSRIGYNIFKNGRWYFEITEPGKTIVAKSFPDVFVWDITDMDSDGRVDIILSPINKTQMTRIERVDGNGVTHVTTGYYLPQWETHIYSWDPVASTPIPKQKVTGRIPFLSPAPQEATMHRPGGYVYPVLIGNESGTTGLYMVDQNWPVNYSHIHLQQFSSTSLPPALETPVATQPTCTATATPSSNTGGGPLNTTITWSSTGATSVGMSHKGTVAPSGSTALTLYPPETVYLTAYGPGGQGSCSVTVAVAPATPAAPTCTMTATPNTGTTGSPLSTTITWSSTGATSAGMSHKGTVAPSGSTALTLYPPETVYLTAYGHGGQSSCSVTVSAAPTPPAAPTCTLTSSSPTAQTGSQITLTWGSTGATSGGFSHGTGSDGTSGSKTLTTYPPETYYYTAYGPGSQTTCQTTVQPI